MISVIDICLCSSNAITRACSVHHKNLRIKNMKKNTIAKIIFVFIIVFQSGLFYVPVYSAEKSKPQTLCPVLGGEINKKIYVDYKGYRIYFCCGGCDQEFKKNPDAYLKKMLDSGITPEKISK
jgi:YHS domain-containing protein